MAGSRIIPGLDMARDIARESNVDLNTGAFTGGNRVIPGLDTAREMARDAQAVGLARDSVIEFAKFLRTDFTLETNPTTGKGEMSAQAIERISKMKDLLSGLQSPEVLIDSSLPRDFRLALAKINGENPLESLRYIREALIYASEYLDFAHTNSVDIKAGG